ncbi:MAG TPA: hypothetical protein VF149_05710 [Bacillales bacterium]
MFRRIGLFIIGSAAILQAQLVLPGDFSFSEVLTTFILNLVDFLKVSLLFLMSFLMFAPFFSHFLRLFYLMIRKKTKIKRVDVAELGIFAIMFLILFQLGFWLPFLASMFALVYGWVSTDFAAEKEIHGFDRG